jgi:hypothetical protein
MIRLILLLLLVAFILALRYLPWWGIVLLVISLALAGRFLGRYLLRSLFMMPFKMKGQVLRRARAEVHSVEPTAAPAGTELALVDGQADEETMPPEPAPPRDYYWIDVTITPTPTTGPFQFWEPGELLLVPIDAKASLDDDETYQVGDVEVFHDGRFGPDEGMKYPGPQRLRVRVGLPVGSPRRWKFRYYFETFGEVVLPDVIDIEAGPVPQP